MPQINLCRNGDVARRWAEHVGQERFEQFEQVLREIVDAQGERLRSSGS